MTSSVRLVADQDAHVNEIVQLYHQCRGHTALHQKKWHDDPRLAIVLANAIGSDRQRDVPSSNLSGIVMTCVRVLARLKACLRRSQLG